jgi:hypothetical protein
MLFLRDSFEYLLLDRGRSGNSLHTHRICIFGMVYLTHFGSYVFRMEPSNTMQTLGTLTLAHRIRLQSSINTQLQSRNAAH